MISADLMIERIIRASSICSGSKTRLYASTTSTAVRSSSAPQTQKYCPLPSSCVAAAVCIMLSPKLLVLLARSFGAGCPSVALRFLLVHACGHQIDQRENKHPDQVHEVPIQSRDFHVVRIVIFGFQNQDHGRHDEPRQQCVDSVVKHTVRWNLPPGNRPDRQQDGQKC